jgi:hypothetical protein
VPGIAANHLRITGDVELTHGFNATGKVSLIGARIDGRLDLSGARLVNPDSVALAAESLTVGQDMLCGGGLDASGEICLRGAHVGGQLDFSGARLGNPYGFALSAKNLSVDQDLLFRDEFASQGKIDLRGSRISGVVDFTASNITNPDPFGRALAASGLHAANLAFNRFTAQGQVDIVGAQIRGQLVFSGARIFGYPNTFALVADFVIVDGSVIGRHGFAVSGGVRMAGARIGGQIDFSGAHLVANPGPRALDAESTTIDQQLLCRDGFTAIGEVNMRSVRVGAQLDFSGAHLDNPDGDALDLMGASADALLLLPQEPPTGVVDLTNTRVGRFRDEQASWPSTLRLRGFVYEIVENDSVDIRTRLGWLAQHEDCYLPEIYDQLAAAYRRAGRVEAARRVGIAKERRHRRELHPLARMWDWLLDLSVGYGYRPWRAALWIVGLLVIGSVMFDIAYPSHMQRATTGAVPEFNPVAYALDALLPFLGLGQENAWIPEGWALVGSWVLKGVGWPLATVVVAGLTGALVRDK